MKTSMKLKINSWFPPRSRPRGPKAGMGRPSSSNRRQSAGAILVLVLLLIALCGAVTSQIASRVIRLSGQAADAQVEAQRRWAAVSMRRTFLNMAPKILANLSQDPNIRLPPVQQRSISVVLGPDRYSVTIQDESAKVPIGRVLTKFPIEQVKPLIRSLAGSGVSLRNVFPAQPTRMSDIIDRKYSGDTSASIRYWQSTSQQMTLWSDGKMNVMTAYPESLKELWQLKFKSTIPDSVLEMRNQEHSNDVSDSVQGLGLSENQSSFMLDWFTVSSSTYSVWINTESGSKSFTAIYVRRRANGFADENIGFHFP